MSFTTIMLFDLQYKLHSQHEYLMYISTKRYTAPLGYITLASLLNLFKEEEIYTKNANKY